MYDPTSSKGVKMTQFDQRQFEGVIIDELFYLTDSLADVDSFRKVNEQEAMNIKSREIISVSPKLNVYVKN